MQPTTAAPLDSRFVDSGMVQSLTFNSALTTPGIHTLKLINDTNDIITYSIIINNNGNLTLSNLSLTDSITTGNNINLREGEIKLLYNAVLFYQENRPISGARPPHQQESTADLDHMKRILFAMIMESNYHAADSV